jgi:hypothetical protein
LLRTPTKRRLVRRGESLREAGLHTGGTVVVSRD